MQPIGQIQTCFKEKFGVPRQSLMVTSAKGIIKLNPDPKFKDALRSLEEFSHIWVIFIFERDEWRPLITTPRLDAPGRIGVFASRSPHRPNPIGMSVVKLDKINLDAVGGIEITVSGVDLLDGTKILDLKPYVPYADSISGAHGAWTETKIPKYEVAWSSKAEAQKNSMAEEERAVMIELLEYDPRPTSQRSSFPIAAAENEGKKFAFRIFEYDVHFEIRNRGIYVVQIDIK